MKCLFISAPPGKGQAPGGLCLFSAKHAGILTYFQTKVNKKTTKKAPFLVILSEVEGPQFRLAALSAVEWDYYKKIFFGHSNLFQIYSLGF